MSGWITPDFEMDGKPYRFILNELDEIGGCCQMDGSDFTECSDCKLEGRCPGQTEDTISSTGRRRSFD